MNQVRITIQLNEFQITAEEAALLEALDAKDIVQTSFVATATVPEDKIEEVRKLPFVKEIRQ